MIMYPPHLTVKPPSPRKFCLPITRRKYHSTNIDVSSSHDNNDASSPNDNVSSSHNDNVSPSHVDNLPNKQCAPLCSRDTCSRLQVCPAAVDAWSFESSKVAWVVLPCFTEVQGCEGNPSKSYWLDQESPISVNDVFSKYFRSSKVFLAYNFCFLALAF